VDILFTIPAGLFLLLVGLLWEPQPKTKKDLKAEQALLVEGEDPAPTTDPKALTLRQQRNYLRRIAMRVLLILTGIADIGVALINGIGPIKEWPAFGLLFALYAGIILIVQRAEKDSRLLVLCFMGFAGWMIWRTANYRNYPVENNWAVLAAALANLAFWYTIGRRFPPGTSDSIEVIGKE
jgi:hypothetical protein